MPVIEVDRPGLLVDHAGTERRRGPYSGPPVLIQAVYRTRRAGIALEAVLREIEAAETACRTDEEIPGRVDQKRKDEIVHQRMRIVDIVHEQLELIAVVSVQPVHGGNPHVPQRVLRERRHVKEGKARVYARVAAASVHGVGHFGAACGQKEEQGQQLLCD